MHDANPNLFHKFYEKLPIFSSFYTSKNLNITRKQQQ